MNNTISLSEALHPEEYRLADIAVYWADEQHSLVYAKDAEAMNLLHSAYVKLLMQCSEFKTLEEHLAAFCQDKQFDERLMQGLRSKLQSLAQQGYLIPRKQPGNDLPQSREPVQSEFKKQVNSSGIIHELPNGLSLICPSTSSIGHIGFLYKEIFQREFCLRHGIVLNNGGCFFDVGANIGLFALYVHTKCEESRIYAFEPIPPTFEILRANARLHHLPAKLFNCGLADRAQTVPFTFYPKLPGLAGRFAEDTSCQALIRVIIEQSVQAWIQADPSRKDDPHLLQEITTSLENEYLHRETHHCPLKTLSQVIQEEQIVQIDLLKVDVESSEIDVLLGIEEHDWPKIQQIILEAHSDELREKSLAILQEHGLTTAADPCPTLEGTEPCHMVYGTRKR
jgi:FkbM family methyltransferase